MPNLTERLNSAVAGHYRINRHLGEGGMAVVYLADDLRHERKVALKVLKPELAVVLGAERFVQEIRTTAALQHPHILPLFDSGTADGFLYYVMPFVEGETLRAKLDRETQLGVSDAVRIACEVADALDYAHRHGVVHRDIKPENILLHDGRPMVADFGIALAISAAAGGRMTETGLSLGTPHYMSPEQATAQKDVDGRSDVFSLGAVLFEMLTGSPPHTGASAQQIIMKIITEPAESVTKLRRSVPPNVAAAVARALEKLPADRFETARAFALALGDASYTSATYVGTRGASNPRRVSPALVGSGGILFIGIAAAALSGWLRPPPEQPVIRYVLQLPAVAAKAGTVPVPAPDGSFLLLLGPQAGSRLGTQLWLKRRDAQEAVSVAGALNPASFAVSPDARWIVYASDGQLRKVPSSGGAPITLVDSISNGGFGMAWLDDGTVVYANGAGTGRLPYLARVSADGGKAAVLTRSDSLGDALPTPIHGARAVLFSRCRSLVDCDLWVADTRTRDAHLVLRGVTWARYATSGQVVFVQENRLAAVAFDVGSLTVRGQPTALDRNATGSGPLELSASGTMVLRESGDTTAAPFDLVWVDRTGRITPVDTSWRFDVTRYANDASLSLSPDGRHVAIGLFTEGNDDIWVKQLPAGPASRLTFDPAPEMRPRWTPDGREVTFLSQRLAGGVYEHRVDGTGRDSLLLAGNIEEAVLSPHSDWLVTRAGSLGLGRGGRDIKGVQIGREHTLMNLIVTPFDEEAIELSPDGRWLAYTSDETGKSEVFIRSFPNTDAVKRQISNGGGTAPLWSRDGREIFFVSDNGDMTTVPIAAGSPITVGSPKALFRMPPELLAEEYAYYTPWDVAADGRFLMPRLRRDRSGAASSVVVAENWLTELKAKMRK